MKNYKEFSKVSIGASDIASLTLRSVRNVGILDFSEDGNYFAYECFGDVEIADHYTKVFSGSTWLYIYDDFGRSYNKSFYSTGEYKNVDVYVCGRTAIIHWHN